MKTLRIICEIGRKKKNNVYCPKNYLPNRGKEIHKDIEGSLWNRKKEKMIMFTAVEILYKIRQKEVQMHPIKTQRIIYGTERLEKKMLRMEC